MNKQETTTTIKELTTNKISNNSKHRVEHSRIGADQAGHVYRYYPEVGWEVLSTFNSSNGYRLVYLEGFQVPKCNIVWACFYGTVRKNMVIHHRNGNKQDDSLENLEMISKKANISIFYRNTTNEHANAIAATRYKYPYRRSLGIEFFIELPQYNVEISNKGTIKSLKTGKELHTTSNTQYPSNRLLGYYKENGKHSSVSLGRLFAEAFMEQPEGPYMVLIKDFDGDLNDPTNYFIYSNKKK